MTTPDETDVAMARVEETVSRLGWALYELDGDVTWRVMSTGTYVGETAKAYAEARAQIDLLWSQYSGFSAAVSEIAVRRKDTGKRSDKSLQIRRELTAQIDAGAAMLAEYEKAATLVASVSAVWANVLPRLEELTGSLAETERKAATVRIPNEAALARRRLAEVRSQAETDPLSLNTAVLTEIAMVVERVTATVEESASARDKLQSGLDEMVVLLDGVRSDLEEAREQHAAAAALIVGITDDGPDRASADALDSLQLALEEARALAASDWQKADRILKSLQRRAKDLAEAATKILARSAESLRRRRELRGRLDAYQAKARALGRAEDLALDALYIAARDVLYAAPCDLEEAESRLLAYQAAITDGRPR